MLVVLVVVRLVQGVCDGRLDHKVSKQRRGERNRRACIYLSPPIAHFRGTMAGTRWRESKKRRSVARSAVVISGIALSTRTCRAAGRRWAIRGRRLRSDVMPSMFINIRIGALDILKLQRPPCVRTTTLSPTNGSDGNRKFQFDAVKSAEDQD